MTSSESHSELGVTSSEATVESTLDSACFSINWFLCHSLLVICLFVFFGASPFDDPLLTVGLIGLSYFLETLLLFSYVRKCIRDAHHSHDWFSNEIIEYHKNPRAKCANEKVKFRYSLLSALVMRCPQVCYAIASGTYKKPTRRFLPRKIRDAGYWIASRTLFFPAFFGFSVLLLSQKSTGETYLFLDLLWVRLLIASVIGLTAISVLSRLAIGNWFYPPSYLKGRPVYSLAAYALSATTTIMCVVYPQAFTRLQAMFAVLVTILAHFAISYLILKFVESGRAVPYRDEVRADRLQIDEETSKAIAFVDALIDNSPEARDALMQVRSHLETLQRRVLEHAPARIDEYKDTGKLRPLTEIEPQVCR